MNILTPWTIPVYDIGVALVLALIQSIAGYVIDVYVILIIIANG